MPNSLSDLHTLHAWEDNQITERCTQGEYAGKVLQFKLVDKDGTIDLTNCIVQYAVTRPDKTEDLLDCTVDNGVVKCNLTYSATSISGLVHGEVRVIGSNNSGTIKFYGVNLCVYKGVSDEAIEQSDEFTALVAALQKVVSITPDPDSENTYVVRLDDSIVQNGLNPVASGVIYNYLQGNYRQISFAHENNESSYGDGGVYIDDATDIMKMYYVINSNGAKVGILFCVRPLGYNYGTQVKIDAYGNITTRVKTQESGETDYTWKSWTPVGTTRNIQDGAVTTPKLANGAVTSAKIGSGEVETTNVSDGAVTTAKIADSAVTAGKLDSNAVTTQKIADSAVTADKLGSSAVTTAKINDGAVTADKLGSSAVTTGKINDGAVTTPKLANGAVTADKLAASVVMSGIIYDYLMDNFYAKTESDNKFQTIANKAQTIDTDRQTTTQNAQQYPSVAAVKDFLNAIQIENDKRFELQTTAGFDENGIPVFTSNNTSFSAGACSVESVKTLFIASNVTTINGGAFNTNANQNITTVYIDNEQTGITIQSGAFPSGATIYYKGQFNALGFVIAALKNLSTSKLDDANNSVKTNHIANLNVTEGKLADGAVTDIKLANKKWNFVDLGQVNSTSVFDDYVNTETIYVVKVAAINCLFFITGNTQVRYLHTVGWEKRRKVNDTWEEWQGAIFTQSIQNNAITTDKIANLNVTEGKLSSELQAKINRTTGIYSYTILASNWSNNAQSLNLSSVYTVTSNTKVDIEADDTVLNQLSIDDCEGIYVENNNGTLTVKAIANSPTENITVQLVVYEVETLS